jgi:hypothetical protein
MDPREARELNTVMVGVAVKVVRDRGTSPL